MKIGDLIECTEGNVFGIITEIVDANPNTGNTEWIYRILWTEPKTYVHGTGFHARDRTLCWERAENFVSLT